MKLKKQHMVLLVVVVVGLYLGFQGSKPVPKMKDVETLAIHLNQAGTTDPAPLEASDEHDRQVIEKVTGWLNSADVEGDDMPHAIPKGGGPTTLEYTLKNGKKVYVEPAYDSDSKKTADGSTQIVTQLVPDLVAVKAGKSGVRLKSPQLQAWLLNGWSKDLAAK